MKMIKGKIILSIVLLSLISPVMISSDPEVDTGQAINITHDSAVLEGELTDIGDEDEVNVSFRYREEEEGWQYAPIEELDEEKEFNEELSFLSHDTTYEFEALVEWNQEENTGGMESFTTLELILPEISTGFPTNTTHESTVLRGELESLGDAEEVKTYFRYREIEEEDWRETPFVSQMSSPGSFKFEVTDLDPNTEYEFMSVYDWEGTEVGGSKNTFWTFEETRPLVDTHQATDIDFNSALLQGELTDLGYEDRVNVSFQYREEDEEWKSTDKEEKDDTEVFQIEVMNLDQSTTYEFRSVVEWKSEDDVMENIGTIETFTTPEEPEPEVQTLTATNIGYTSALIEGAILELEREGIEAFFRYRAEGEGWERTVSVEMDEEAEFTENLENLEPGEEYEFQAVLKWEEEEFTGETENFKTLGSPLIRTVSVEDILSESATLKGRLVGIEGPEVEVFFEYKEEGDFNWSSTDSRVMDEPGNFTFELEDLSSNSTYSFRAVAEYNGEEQRSEGDTLDFETLKRIEDLEPDLLDLTFLMSLIGVGIVLVIVEKRNLL